MKKVQIDPKGKTILCVAAHPDDIDFGSSGTIAKWVKEGATVYYAIFTDGTKGSEDMGITAEQLKSTRYLEQQEAAKVLGVRNVYFFDFVDGELENNSQTRKPLVKLIRTLKPDVVMTMDPTFVYDEDLGFINHPDHRVAGQITLDVVFPFARNARSYPDLLEEGHFSHIVWDVLLVNFTKANCFVDISDTVETKLNALKKHRSQYNEFEKVKEWVNERADLYGKKAKCQKAEGFVHIRLKA